MPNPERAVVKMSLAPESLKGRMELRAARFALDNKVDVEYIFRGQVHHLSLEEAIKAYSPEKVEERITELADDLGRDTQRLLEKETFTKEEMEKEKKYAKMASEINL